MGELKAYFQKVMCDPKHNIGLVDDTNKDVTFRSGFTMPRKPTIEEPCSVSQFNCNGETSGNSISAAATSTDIGLNFTASSAKPKTAADFVAPSMSCSTPSGSRRGGAKNTDCKGNSIHAET